MKLDKRVSTFISKNLKSKIYQYIDLGKQQKIRERKFKMETRGRHAPASF